MARTKSPIPTAAPPPQIYTDLTSNGWAIQLLAMAGQPFGVRPFSAAFVSSSGQRKTKAA